MLLLLQEERGSSSRTLPRLAWRLPAKLKQKGITFYIIYKSRSILIQRARTQKRPMSFVQFIV